MSILLRLEHLRGRPTIGHTKITNLYILLVQYIHGVGLTSMRMKSGKRSEQERVLVSLPCGANRASAYHLSRSTGVDLLIVPFLVDE